MPEVPLCIYCNTAVVLEEQSYVILNKHVAERADWEYAHTECHAASCVEHSEAPEDFAVGV